MKKKDELELELAWAAGLWDGEGCTHQGRYKQGWTTKDGTKKYGTYLHRTISMCQYHDPEVLVRFISAVGVGKLLGPYTAKATGNQYWQIYLPARKGMAVLEKLWPYLSEPKKKQALGVFPELGD